MSFFAFVISVVMGVGALAFAYSVAGYDKVLYGLLAVGIFWLFSGWKRWAWASPGGILLLVALAGYGLWIELSPGWMLAGTLGGIMAWDLSEFMRRMDVAPDSINLRDIQLRHVTRLTLVGLIGLLLASIAMFIRVELTLEWLMLLALIGVLGLTQLVAWLRRGG